MSKFDYGSNHNSGLTFLAQNFSAWSPSKAPDLKEVIPALLTHLYPNIPLLNSTLVTQLISEFKNAGFGETEFDSASSYFNSKFEWAANASSLNGSLIDSIARLWGKVTNGSNFTEKNSAYQSIVTGDWTTEGAAAVEAGHSILLASHQFWAPAGNPEVEYVLTGSETADLIGGLVGLLGSGWAGVIRGIIGGILASRLYTNCAAHYGWSW